MKLRLVAIFSIFFLIIFISAQPTELLGQNYFVKKIGQRNLRTTPTNGGMFSIGRNALAYNFIIFWQDSLANLGWSQTFQSDSVVPELLIGTQNGGAIIGGKKSPFYPPSNLLFLLNLAQNGDTIWSKTFQSNSFEINPTGMFLSHSGEIIVTAYTNNHNGGLGFFKFDTLGNFISAKNFYSTGQYIQKGIWQTRDDGYLFSIGPKLIRLDSALQVVWTKIDVGGFPVELSNGNIVSVSEGSDSSGRKNRIVAKSVDQNGNNLWTSSYEKSVISFFGLGKVVPTNDGGFLFSYYDMDNLEFLWYLARVSANGQLEWTQTFYEAPGPLFYEYTDLHSLAVLPDQSILFVCSRSYANYGIQFCFPDSATCGPCWCVPDPDFYDVTPIQLNQTNISISDSVLQLNVFNTAYQLSPVIITNYQDCSSVNVNEKEYDENWSVSPNPILNSAHIKINIPTSEFRKLTLVRSDGKIMHSQNLVAPTIIDLEMTDFPPGIYLVSLSNDMHVSTKIIVVE